MSAGAWRISLYRKQSTSYNNNLGFLHPVSQDSCIRVRLVADRKCIVDKLDHASYCSARIRVRLVADRKCNVQKLDHASYCLAGIRVRQVADRKCNVEKLDHAIYMLGWNQGETSS